MNENLLSQVVYVDFIWVIIYSIIQYNKTEIAYFTPCCDIRINSFSDEIKYISGLRFVHRELIGLLLFNC